MAYPLIPKLRVPFRVIGGRADVVDQDSVDEVAQGVEYLLRTEPGTRLEVPEFGLPDPAFATGHLSELIRTAIDRWEPRARMALSTEEIEQLTERVLLQIGTGGSNG